MKTTAKQRVAEACLQEIRSGIVLGVGTGTTVDCLIDLLPSAPKPRQIVSSSARTTKRLQERGFEVVSYNNCDPLDLYIDGADQVIESKIAIKGKGGAHTMEKILASGAERFVGIITKDKWVRAFSCPVPVEVMPEARSAVAREMLALGGEPSLREGRTEHGNIILDVYHLDMKVEGLEGKIKQIPGVIESGLFSNSRFDKVYIDMAGQIKVV